MHLKKWYRNLLVVWMPVGLLIFILGWGFAGEAPWMRLLLMFETAIFDPVSVALTLFAWALLLSPLLLLPFGIGRKAIR